MITNRLVNLMAVAALVGLVPWTAPAQEPAKPKFDVKIRDEKTVVVDMEDSGVIDPVKRINFQAQGNFMANITTMTGEMLHLSHFPMFQINGRIVQPQQGMGRFEAQQPLPKAKSGRQREGFTTAWTNDSLRITQTMELHPSKPKKPGDKRLMNTVLITYTIENKGTTSQTLGARIYMDTFVIDNDGCLFAAPTTHPKKILDGVVLQDKTLPPYLQMLQFPNLERPGYVAHLTLDMGGKYEKPSKLILSSFRVGAGGWDMPVSPAMNDSAISFYWPTKEIKAGAKRELAYAYGENIAVRLGSEGRFEVALGGSYEPGKIFNISAVVADPGLGQTLHLELPPGLQRLEGKEIEPVAPLADEQQYSTVLWKARVMQPGEYSIRIRSSTGITQTKILTITAQK